MYLQTIESIGSTRQKHEKCKYINDFINMVALIHLFASSEVV
jgi:hypothetical protein